MMDNGLARLRRALERTQAGHAVGRVAEVREGLLTIAGLDHTARVGDRVRLFRAGRPLHGEILRLGPGGATVLPEGSAEGVALGDRAAHFGPPRLAPCAAWLGRVLDPHGHPLDGGALPVGGVERPLDAPAPGPAERRGMGGRLATGLAVFDTLLPFARGQRLGLFAPAGAGKSSLLARLLPAVEADVVVVALVGERGREVAETVVRLGAGRDRSVIIAATADQPPVLRRRCALAAMVVAEHFRECGAQVLLAVDSITRMAEAHREVALAVGEAPALGGFPASTAALLTALCERAGPGAGPEGDITALLSVLTPGTEEEGPVAEMLRGVIDGHVVLSREIAERGRFPAVDLPRSLSRSLPGVATGAENAAITEARRLLAAHDRAALMLQSGLYRAGGDPVLDRAVSAFEALDAFIAQPSPGVTESFEALASALGRDGHALLAELRKTRQCGSEKRPAPRP